MSSSRGGLNAKAGLERAIIPCLWGAGPELPPKRSRTASWGVVLSVAAERSSCGCPCEAPAETAAAVRPSDRPVRGASRDRRCRPSVRPSDPCEAPAETAAAIRPSDPCEAPAETAAAVRPSIRPSDPYIHPSVRSSVVRPRAVALGFVRVRFPRAAAEGSRLVVIGRCSPVHCRKAAGKLPHGRRKAAGKPRESRGKAAAREPSYRIAP